METLPVLAHRLMTLDKDGVSAFALENGFPLWASREEMVLGFSILANCPEAVTALITSHPHLLNAPLPEGPFALFADKAHQGEIQKLAARPTPLGLAIAAQAWAVVHALLDCPGIDPGQPCGLPTEKPVMDDVTPAGEEGGRRRMFVTLPNDPPTPLGLLAGNGIPQEGGERWAAIVHLLAKGATPVGGVPDLGWATSASPFASFLSDLMGRPPPTPAHAASACRFFSLFPGFCTGPEGLTHRLGYQAAVDWLFDTMGFMERGYEGFRMMGDTRGEEEMKDRIRQWTGVDTDACTDMLLVWFVKSGFDPDFLGERLEKSPVARALVEQDVLGKRVAHTRTSLTRHPRL